MNKLEKEFQAQVTLHGKEIDDAYAKVVELSEKYGIPFGMYIPKSFNKYRSKEGDPPDYEYTEGVGPKFIDNVCKMADNWLSSTTQCEFYGGY